MRKGTKVFLWGAGGLTAVIVIASVASAGHGSGTTSGTTAPQVTSSAPASGGPSYTLKSCYQVMPIVSDIETALKGANPRYESLSNQASSAASIASHDGAMNGITLSGDLSTLSLDLLSADGGKASAQALRADLKAVTTDCHT